MDPKIKQFIEKNQKVIEEGNWATLFQKYILTPHSAPNVGALIELLYAADVYDPDDYASPKIDIDDVTRIANMLDSYLRLYHYTNTARVAHLSKTDISLINNVANNILGLSCYYIPGKVRYRNEFLYSNLYDDDLIIFFPEVDLQTVLDALEISEIVKPQDFKEVIE